MACIKLDDASVTFAIYNTKTRSVRHNIFKAVGGRVSNIDHNVYINAVDNVSLEIKDGDKIGLIGHNGAGKSTMLKLVSGIYEPTKGSVKIDGSVSSLTDITMGMDPENSGYDNIIMRLIFMGLTFKQAREKIDEIIDFSELGEYIDLPMRTYSTGMYTRLAFTIATSIIPDILVMDEMIGAGDASFIKKTKQRSLEMVAQTKIMVLSSHDMNLLKEICNYGIWMEKGKIVMRGPIQDVIAQYSVIH
jgi:ABC-type polysaccharide/polyol phosphate transport system ATPase subunit